MILHGHNMRDGRMFGTLKYYEDYDFYLKHPTFTFNTIYEKSEWKIISILKTNTLWFVLRPGDRTGIKNILIAKTIRIF